MLAGTDRYRVIGAGRRAIVVSASSDSARDLESASVLITAVDRADLILKKLLRNRPRHIVHPFHII